MSCSNSPTPSNNSSSEGGFADFMEVRPLLSLPSFPSLFVHHTLTYKRSNKNKNRNQLHSDQQLHHQQFKLTLEEHTAEKVI